MKKILTLAAVLAASTFTYGQRWVDLSVTDIVSPDTLYSTAANGTQFLLNVSVENTGPEDLYAGDTIWYNVRLAAGTTLIAEYPVGANQYGAVVVARILDRDVVAGDTLHIVNNTTIGRYPNATATINLVVGVHASNRPDLNFETSPESTNNYRSESRVWFNPERWPLSINSVDQSVVSVYPNPAADRINITSNIVNTTQNSVVSVYDAQGKMVYTNTIQAGTFNNTEVNTQNFKNGVYIYRIQSGDQLFSGKFIVQH